jgi:hypothetical protein
MCVSTPRKLIIRLGREVTATKDGQRVDNELFPLPSLSMLDLLVPRSMFADPNPVRPVGMVSMRVFGEGTEREYGVMTARFGVWSSDGMIPELIWSQDPGGEGS